MSREFRRCSRTETVHHKALNYLITAILHGVEDLSHFLDLVASKYCH